MILLNILKELLLVGTVINLSKAEIDSEAISQVRFVQYQPIPEKSSTLSHNNAGTQKELNAEATGHIPNSLKKSNFQRNVEEADLENLSIPKNYAFSYAIKDGKTGDDFSHTQAHNGQATKGEYRVKLPDGRLQVVSYTADNGGYKADIRYDNNDAAQEASNNRISIFKGFSDDFSSSSRQPKPNTNFDKNVNLDNFNFDSLREKKKFSPSNGFGSFNNPSSTRKPASYETTENVDEELFPYSKKLLDDVNYLLQYVTPTIESHNRGREKISIDFSKSRFLNDDPQFKNKFKSEQSSKEKFQLPANFPYQFTKFEEPKFEKLSFNEPNYEDHTFIEPSLMGPKQENDKFFKLKFQSPKQESQSLNNQLFSGSRLEELRSNFPKSNEKFVDSSKFNNQKYEVKPVHPHRTHFKNDNSFRYNGPNAGESQFGNSNFPKFRNNNAPRQEGIQFVPSDSNNLKFDEIKQNSQNNDKIVLQKSNYEGETFNAPKFDPKAFENGNFEEAKFQTPNYNTFSDSSNPKFINPVTNDDNNKPNSVEIPQYIHIHRYEASGEDQTNNARPKELIYYNPLQIPVPNSIAYMEHGSYNISNPQRITLTPSYITMTEHPRAKPTDAPPHYNHHINAPEFPLKLNTFDQSKENYFGSTPQTPAPSISPKIPENYANKPIYENRPNNNPNNLNPPTLSYPQKIPENNENQPEFNYEPNNLNQPPPLQFSQKIPENYDHTPTYNYDENKLNPPPAPIESPVTPEPPSEDHSNNYENTIGGLPPFFDPRAYSGYFDFLPSSGEAEQETEKENAPENNINHPFVNDHTETQKNELPQYYYDFSTATPSHKYVSSAEVALSSQEDFQPVLDPNQIRNTSFLASAYLRPLHKERVYIYHNSLPTVSAEENHNFSPTTPFEPKQTHKNDADVQIIRSISSTIPPELLKDFDRQLSSSIFTRSDDSNDANSELKQVKVSSDSESSPRLRSDIVKQLQSTLATNAVPYLKTPTQQKRISR